MTTEYLIPKIDHPWFQGDRDSRPMATFDQINVMMVVYLAIITVGCYLMRGRKPFETLWLTVPQNAFMCLYSLYAFLGMFETLWKNWSAQGRPLFMIICDPKQDMMVNMDFWMYTFFLSKVCLLRWRFSFSLLVRGVHRLVRFGPERKEPHPSWLRWLSAACLPPQHHGQYCVDWMAPRVYCGVGWSRD